ncbi:MAG: restriction endonuclease subunit S [Candidatus Pacebacteria bacterium]|jgi:restriction endonuclease S subunit|nr:restriction endonuclease subunit S [Candidatus Paceibacterota bacterium]
MQVKLEQIANIISGYTFRGALENNSDGNVFVLQAKNIIAGQKLNGNQNLSRILFEKARGQFFLQNNDIVIVSRGSGIGSFRAAVFQDLTTNIVVASSVYIIRAISDKVLPDYVSVFINSSEGQKRIMETATGSHIKALLRSEIVKINIPLPEVDKQRIIVKLAKNLKQQEEICYRKIQIKKNIANSIFEKI